MSKLGWFLAGIGVGAYALKELRDNPKAQQAVDDLYVAAKDFGTSVLEGYKEREAELAKMPAAKTATKSTAAKTAAKPSTKKS